MDAELILGLDALIRSDLQNIRDTYFNWLLVSSALVVIGVALEGPELYHEVHGIVRIRFKPNEDFSKREAADWIKIVGLLGWMLVVIGVLGEGIAEAYVSRADGILQTFNDILLADAQRHAADADERASANEKEAAKLRIDLESEKQKTARFQKEADDARLALETRVHTQGPRYFLLRAAASKLARDLSRFAGQRAALLICGMYRTERETLETWGALASILGPDTVNGVKGADWKMVRGDPIWEKCSLSMQGIAVMVSSESPKSTRDAAEALSKGLLNALPPYNKNPGIIDPAWVRLKMSQGVNLEKDDPERLAAEDPSLIVVFIGEHPPQ